jgi:hypothetical protein
MRDGLGIQLLRCQVEVSLPLFRLMVTHKRKVLLADVERRKTTRGMTASPCQP